MKNFKSSNFRRSIVSLLLILSIVFGGIMPGLALADQPVKNIILLIGDGMGQSHITLARIAKESGLYMDTMPVTGSMSTHPLKNQDKWVTDSAAAGTAIATGSKTYNGYIAVDANKKPLETILEKAKKNKKSTGLVTTTRITHATPAVFASHTEDRDDENTIAKQMLDSNVDIMLGGGKRHFLPKDKSGKREDMLDLIKYSKDKGYDLVENRENLLKSKSNKILGLFNSSHLNYHIDKEKNEPSLAEMTGKSIELLNKNKNGFFLMVEGGRIDHSSHSNDSATTAKDLLAFDQAIKTALDFAKADKNTLVIVTADHETGGLSIGSKGIYDFEPEVLRQQKISFEKLSSKLENNLKAKDVEEKLGLKLDQDNINSLNQSLKEKFIEELRERVNLSSRTGWTTDAHTATDVPIKAYGPNSQKFGHHMDNTDLNKLMLKSFGF